MTPYYHAKWEEEQAVKYSGLEHVIFRPSFVFGTDGGILPQQIRLVRYSPVTPILGRHRMQPIWIDDVAAFFVGAVSGGEATNRTFDLGGPDRLTWTDLHALIRKMLGKHPSSFSQQPHPKRRYQQGAIQWHASSGPSAHRRSAAPRWSAPPDTGASASASTARPRSKSSTR